MSCTCLADALDEYATRCCSRSPSRRHRDSRAAMRIVDLIRASQNSFEYQSKVIELVNMPNWLNESARLPVKTIDEFRELRVHDIRYSYKPNDTLVPAAIDLYGTVAVNYSFWHEILLTTQRQVNN